MTAIWCLDLDGTITSTPDLMRAISQGLREAGSEVHILTGCHDDEVTPDVEAEKAATLKASDFKQGRDYDKAIVVSGPKKKVAKNKVNYMEHVSATGLIDNSKRNIKAARKAGFMGVRHFDPK